MESTKDRILKAALHVMREQGSSFSMRKVAEEAGLSLGNLQYHFKTKATLVKSLLDHYLTVYQRRMDELIESQESGRKDTLEMALTNALCYESLQEEDEFEQVFLGLSGSGPLSAELKEHFYTKVYNLLFGYLTEFCPGSSDRQRHRATSFLLPYLESFTDVEPYLHIEAKEMACILADTAWRLLHSAN